MVKSGTDVCPAICLIILRYDIKYCYKKLCHLSFFWVSLRLIIALYLLDLLCNWFS